MQYFKTAQLYFKSIIDQFDILAVSEHSLFEEQLGILKTATDGTYNYHAVSASDNPRIISGEKAHGGVALLWKYSINDFVTPIKSIQSDRIVGIKCEFSGCRPLFILGVYLHSSNQIIRLTSFKGVLTFFGLCMNHCRPTALLLCWAT